MNELNQELRSDRSSVHGPSGSEELISSLTAEREQLRSQLQEQTERVRNWKPSEDVRRSFWSGSVVLSCSSSSLQAAETHALLQGFQEEVQHHRQKNAGLLELSQQKDSDVSAAPPPRRFPLRPSADGWESSEQVEKLSGDLQRLREDLATAQRSVEVEELQAALAAIAAERDQLKTDLQENVEMVGPHACVCVR